MSVKTMFLKLVAKSVMVTALLVLISGGLLAGDWYSESSYPGSGNMQSMSIYVCPSGTEAIEGYWKNNEGWSRKIPVFGYSISWDDALSWNGPFPLSMLPGSGSIQSQNAFVTPDKQWVIQGIWQGNEGWSRKVPVINGTISWGDASDWSRPILLSMLPGYGSVQAQSGFLLPNSGRLFQRFWRSNQCYWRSVPCSGGTVYWDDASEWFGPYGISTLPGSGSMQATTAYRLPNNKYVEERFFRGNYCRKRTLRFKKLPSFILNPRGISYADWIFTERDWIPFHNGPLTGGDDYYAITWEAMSGYTEGATARAMAPGVVIYAGSSPAGWHYGKQVVVQCLDDPTFVYRYAHLVRIDVSVGEVVGLDTRLGLVGGTPSYGPHLFAVLYKNIYPNTSAMFYLKHGKSPSGYLDEDARYNDYAAMYHNY